MEAKKKPNLTGWQDGKTLSVVGDTYRIVLSGAQTNGEFAMIDMIIPPGGGPGPHAHAAIDETFFVIDGEVEFRSEEGVNNAVKGSLINIPKGGLIHCFKNKSDKVAHLLCTVQPAGLDEFFEKIGQPVELGKFLPPPEMTPETMEKLKKIAEEFGQELFPPDSLG